jgi:1,4-alpha-glucan branching enzyme
MSHLRVSRENRITTTGFLRVDLDTTEASLNPKMTPEGPALEEQEIILTLLAPEAKEVKVAGDFNGWRPEATLLKNTGAGEWVVRLSLRSGLYEYRFVVDGCWSEDPRAAQRAANPHGGFNSVLLVPLTVRTSIL